MKTRGATTQNKYAPEFSGWLLWIIVGLFCINNFYFKHTYNNWLTGKLSDFTVCFFLPLYCSAALKLVFNLQLRARLIIGCFITLAILTALKLSYTLSVWHDVLLSQFTKIVGLGVTHNHVDASDLIALPIVYLAYRYGEKRNHDFYR